MRSFCVLGSGMQGTQESVESIIETGWHHFSVPPYRKAAGPRLYCWCGGGFVLPVAPRQLDHFSAFLRAHAECRPNLAFLQGDAHANP